MKKKGFTLVELLAVIAILELLVIIALPNVLKMFNQAKKDTFLTESKNIYKEISKKYITETMRGNKISNISNNNNKLDLESNNLKYNIKLNNDGSIKNFEVSNGTYCISGKFNNLSELTTDKITEGECESKEPKDFATDSWKIIVEAVKEGNDEVYNVGDTKKIDLGTSYGTHTLRIANKSDPSECSTEGFSQTACGFVLEFVDIITTRGMNEASTNVGGWPATSMRWYLNNRIYDALPIDLKNSIINTITVSGHGKTSGEQNFTSTDKLYLLSPKEIYINWSDSYYESLYDTAKDLTRTLDYYTNIGAITSSHDKTIKKIEDTAKYWWLRTASSHRTDCFINISPSGSWFYGNPAVNSMGISPAFRLG